MASISSDAKGTSRVQFVGTDGLRKTIRLGSVPQKTAAMCKQRIEALAASRRFGMPLDEATASWVGMIDDEFAERLSRFGLIEPRRRQKLGEFLDEYAASRVDIKPATRTNIDQAKKRLVKFFGADRPMAEITPVEAAAFKDDLMKNYARATAGRCVRRAKQFFTAAFRLKIIPENVFADVKGHQQTNSERKRFIDRATTDKLLEAAPDVQWRVIIALSRFGGIRCPSEHLQLKWGDINWANERFWVTSPKTEHHPGRDGRWVPLFPELRAILEEAFDVAEPGTLHVITRTRDASVNWRTGLQRIIRKAGLTAWPKLFHNLRASRETELAAEFPLHVVTEWIGNSSMVALKHYLTVTDDDFARAAKGGAKSGALEVQKAAQHPPAATCTDSQNKTQALHDVEVMRTEATICEHMQTRLVPRSGLEPETR